MPTTRRLPIGATLLTLLMVPVLIGLGVWQLQRREWKHQLIARLEAAKTLPPVTAHDYYRAMIGVADLQYRHAEVDCRPGRVAPYDVKGGTSAGGDEGGQGGFLILVDCNDPARHAQPDLVVVAGWTLRPDTIKQLDLDTHFSGTLIDRPYGTEPGRPQFMLIPTTAAPGLLPSRVPVPDDLPDNHLSYALQWFAFAATLGVIYAVYVRQWRRQSCTSSTSG
jgi:surfeit locus 1 family protein